MEISVKVMCVCMRICVCGYRKYLIHAKHILISTFDCILWELIVHLIWQNSVVDTTEQFSRQWILSMGKPYFLNINFSQVLWWTAWFNMQFKDILLGNEEGWRTASHVNLPNFHYSFKLFWWKLMVQINLCPNAPTCLWYKCRIKLSWIIRSY